MGWNRLCKKIYDVISYPIIPPAGKTREMAIRENDLKWYHRTGYVESICERSKQEEAQEREEGCLGKDMARQILFDTGCHLECRAAFEVGKNDWRPGRHEDPWAQKIRLGKMMLHNFYSIKETEVKLVKKLHAGGSDSCLVGTGSHSRYGRILYLHAEIPTFDSYDRQSDSYHDVYFLSDGKAIHFLCVRGGYSVAWVGAGIGVTGADRQLMELFKKADFPVESLQLIQ